MSGIIGYIGSRPAIPILMQGLEKLEYRGYDSAGIGWLQKDKLVVKKNAGKLDILKAQLNSNKDGAQLGIGHLRWATHGCPSDVNAHPHLDCGGKLAVVHNGIIDNYWELQQKLTTAGHSFTSETDTEVLAHLVEHYYRGDLLQSVLEVLPMLRGLYAFAVISRNHPQELVAVSQGSPLFIGRADGGAYLASDIPALLPYTRDVYILERNELAQITPQKVVIYDGCGKVKIKDTYHVSWDLETAEKGGYEHFMLKEIHEQPQALKNTLRGRLREKGQVHLEGVNLTPPQVTALEKAVIIACGTASYAGMVGKYLLEKLLRLPVESDVASEFCYRNPIINKHTLGLVISQSGETADTLAGLREAQKCGSRILAVTNVVNSTVARSAEHILYTWAGPEIAVASTKAYITQVAAMYLLALYLGQKRGNQDWAVKMVAGLRDLPDYVQAALELEPQIRGLAKKLASQEHAFFIGRGLDYYVSLEGALKLKEVSYIHGEAYAAGELKHGTLALIKKGTPVIALATQEELLEKMLNNIKEVKARGAWVLALTQEGNEAVAQEADAALELPPVPGWLAPPVAVVPLQLLAYYTAVARGCNVDNPRNLVKSVTVE